MITAALYPEYIIAISFLLGVYGAVFAYETGAVLGVTRESLKMKLREAVRVVRTLERITLVQTNTHAVLAVMHRAEK